MNTHIQTLVWSYFIFFYVYISLCYPTHTDTDTHTHTSRLQLHPLQVLLVRLHGRLLHGGELLGHALVLLGLVLALFLNLTVGEKKGTVKWFKNITRIWNNDNLVCVCIPSSRVCVGVDDRMCLFIPSCVCVCACVLMISCVCVDQLCEWVTVYINNLKFLSYLSNLERHILLVVLPSFVEFNTLRTKTGFLIIIIIVPDL